MTTLFHEHTEKTEAVLYLIAHMPSKSLSVLMNSDFVQELCNIDFMRIVVFLAQKSYNEGGCAIGAVINDDSTRQIVGMGHNTLVQDNHP